MSLVSDLPSLYPSRSSIPPSIHPSVTFTLTFTLKTRSCFTWCGQKHTRFLRIATACAMAAATIVQLAKSAERLVVSVKLSASNASAHKSHMETLSTTIDHLTDPLSGISLNESTHLSPRQLPNKPLADNQETRSSLSSELALFHISPFYNFLFVFFFGSLALSPPTFSRTEAPLR